MGLGCGHKYCKDCWCQYLEMKITVEGAAESIQCPTGKCSIIVDDNLIMQIITDENVRQKYQHLMTNSFVVVSKIFYHSIGHIRQYTLISLLHMIWTVISSGHKKCSCYSFYWYFFFFSSIIDCCAGVQRSIATSRFEIMVCCTIINRIANANAAIVVVSIVEMNLTIRSRVNYTQNGKRMIPMKQLCIY